MVGATSMTQCVLISVDDAVFAKGLLRLVSVKEISSQRLTDGTCGISACAYAAKTVKQRLQDFIVGK